MRRNYFNKELYDHQKDFIRDAIAIIESEGVGVFSSPTGTGKTVSLLSTIFNVVSNKQDDLYDLLGDNNLTEVYYCSRTHLQLQQVFKEFKSARDVNIKMVTLGSRKQLCINKSVNRPEISIEAINEKCKDLCIKGECKYYRGVEGIHNNKLFEGNMTAEEMKEDGKALGYCPYFYSKKSLTQSQIVLLPYNLIFTKEGRESIDLADGLSNKILVLDEAHNIISTVIQLNTEEVFYKELSQIVKYKGISQELTLVLHKLLNVQRMLNLKHTEEKCYKVVDFIIEASLLNINLIEIDDYIREKKIAQKNEDTAVFKLAKFLKLLIWSSDKEAIVIVSNFSIKFTPLSAKMYFEDILKAKAIILAGGTMEPIEPLMEILGSTNKEIIYHTYPSISSDFEAILLTKSNLGNNITLNYQSRDSLFSEVISTIIALSNVVELNGGVVIFLPSKYYLALFKNYTNLCLFKKKVYYEDTFDFRAFSATPGVLVAILGGKFSEGINFADEMCRLLIVVGVPYPSLSMEYKKRLEYNKNYGSITAMGLVNQALGRALRHKKDYSSLVIIDERYLNLRKFISPWINSKIKHLSCLETIKSIKKFLNR